MSTVKKGQQSTSSSVMKIRITLTSRKVKALETVCAGLIQRAKSKKISAKGPVRLPTKNLKLTVRKSPCGEGTNTWDRYEMRIHKRIIDLLGTSDDVREITAIYIDPSVNVEVTVGN